MNAHKHSYIFLCCWASISDFIMMDVSLLVLECAWIEGADPVEERY